MELKKYTIIGEYHLDSSITNLILRVLNSEKFSNIYLEGLEIGNHNKNGIKDDKYGFVVRIKKNSKKDTPHVKKENIPSVLHHIRNTKYSFLLIKKERGL